MDPYNSNLFTPKYVKRDTRSERDANRELANSKQTNNDLNSALADMAGGISRKPWS